MNDPVLYRVIFFMKNVLFFSIVFWAGSLSCSQTQRSDTQPTTRDQIHGVWYASLAIEPGNSDLHIDFILDLDTGGSIPGNRKLSAWLVNANERIPQHAEWISEDSVRISSLYFDSWIEAKVTDSAMSGIWYNRYRSPDYKMHFSAGRSNYLHVKPENIVVDGKWEVVFAPGTDNEEPAIGIFNETGNGEVTGTFLTETGDYRFLHGAISSEGLRLSTFDGSHAYLFKARLGGGDTLHGHYYSGHHYHTTWVAWRNDSVKLSNPYQLTGVKIPEKPMKFEFTDLEGKPVALLDTPYKGKPVVIQLMGSWCPNCMDETIYLKSIYSEMQKAGVELISLAFEAADSADAIALLKRYKANMGMDWRILYAGSHSKEEAARRLPQLERIYSFPTTIYLRPDHTVYAIHTGFNGPGTGPLYEEQSEQMMIMIRALQKMKSGHH